MREPLAHLARRQAAAQQRGDDRVRGLARRAGLDQPAGDGVGGVPAEQSHPGLILTGAGSTSEPAPSRTYGVVAESVKTSVFP